MVDALSDDDEDFTLFSQLPSRVLVVSSSDTDTTAEECSDASATEQCGHVGAESHAARTSVRDSPAIANAEPGAGCRKRQQVLLESSDEEAETGDQHASERLEEDRSAGKQAPRRTIRSAESSDENEGVDAKFPAESFPSENEACTPCDEDTATGPAGSKGTTGRGRNPTCADEHGDDARQSRQHHASEADDEHARMQTAKVEDPSWRHKTPKKVRVAYNQLVREAQGHEKAGQLGRAVASYKEALALCDQDDKLVRKVQKLENLRAVRRQSRRQSVAVSQMEFGDPACEAQEGWFYDGSRALYALCENPEYGLAADLYNRLLPYQRDGVRWLWQLHCAGQGGILGDEMGLGKTCQTVIYLGGSLEAGHAKHILVVAPVSVLSVWCREFDKFCPNLSVMQAGEGGQTKPRRVRPLLFHGSSVAERERNLSAVVSRGGVLITSYGLASSAKSLGKLCRVEWDYIVCDEGHKLKNPNIQTSKGMRQLRARHRLLLTGTPLQNNLQELRALYDFAVPGLLPSAEEFKERYARPITDGADRDATPEQQRLGEERARQLRDIIRPYQLARTKAHVFGGAGLDAGGTGAPVLGTDRAAAGSAGAMAAGSGDGDDGGRGGESENSLARGPQLGGVGLEVTKTEWMVWLELSPLQKLIYREFLDSDRVKQVPASSPFPCVYVCVRACASASPETYGGRYLRRRGRRWSRSPC